jgi:putative glutamine amidotransferase
MTFDIAIATRDFHYAFESMFHEEIPILENNPEHFEDAKLIIFSGGQDINPEIYGQENRYSYCNLNRDSVELDFLNRALKENKKILGVCRGHQLINAYLGGDMVQDLKKDLKIQHGGGHKLVYLTQASIIKSFFDGGVNSIHHQGVIKPGKELTPTSEYLGVLESCENENIITVQFHPEFMTNSEESYRFFNYLKFWKERQTW